VDSCDYLLILVKLVKIILVSCEPRRRPRQFLYLPLFCTASTSWQSPAKNAPNDQTDHAFPIQTQKANLHVFSLHCDCVASLNATLLKIRCQSKLWSDREWRWVFGAVIRSNFTWLIFCVLVWKTLMQF
jgi:hypothetical protein